jgi:hypothetical protein
MAMDSWSLILTIKLFSWLDLPVYTGGKTIVNVTT